MEAKKTPEKASPRKRRLPDIYGGRHHLDEKFVAILQEGDQDSQVYVYRAKDDWPVPPYLFKCYPFRSLEDRIRDEYGAGEYAIVIRRGKPCASQGSSLALCR